MSKKQLEIVFNDASHVTVGYREWDRDDSVLKVWPQDWGPVIYFPLYGIRRFSETDF